MNTIVYSLAFVALWWLLSAAMFLGTVWVIDRDEAVKFVEDIWRLIRL